MHVEMHLTCYVMRMSCDSVELFNAKHWYQTQVSFNNNSFTKI